MLSLTGMLAIIMPRVVDHEKGEYASGRDDGLMRIVVWTAPDRPWRGNGNGFVAPDKKVVNLK
jgi:hypothetical protein